MTTICSLSVIATSLLVVHFISFSTAQGPLPGTCALHPEMGPCKASDQRYYYDKDTGTCKTFTYGGCGGNTNNFLTKEDCENRCHRGRVCYSPPDTGSCNVLFERYYYNKETGTCQKFMYGGCKGNANNFLTQEACEHKCQIGGNCNSPPEKGPCKAGIKRYYYDKETHTCQSFSYGGCRGNANNFLTKKDCENACQLEGACDLPVEIGPCRGRIQRYYYDTQTGTCQSFYYSGCGANKNNFYSKISCENNCITGRACDLSPEVGPCKKNTQLYYYDKDSGTCKTFIYGGCKGNQNKFVTQEACESHCKPGGACDSASETGPCRQHMERYYYNKHLGACQTFVYGGCGGNQNNFVSQEACESHCKPGRACDLSPEVGPCMGNIPRFYYDKYTGTCQTFYYGGCQGNPNNFHTREACESKCKPGVPCNLPSEKGPCLADIERYHYNKETGTCKTFTYGGCQGNANNFPTKDDCENMCQNRIGGICNLLSEKGPCLAYMEKYYYNTETGTCQTFTYGGCQGNANNFATEEDCKNSCQLGGACDLHPEGGPCKAKIPRYYYDIQSGTCKPFSYGGCGGNKNNYVTQQSCESHCNSGRTCYLPPVKGPCRAHIERYYYNKETHTCQTFSYGGCQGNANNFPTKKDCENACQLGGACDLPPEVGPCRAKIPHYFYDRYTGTCQIFFYGGCAGNKNNYETQEACQGNCKSGGTCNLPSEKGPCFAQIKRYYYNNETGTCQTFTFGGCQGNANNFPSRKVCENECQSGGSCDLPSEVGPCRAHVLRYYYDMQSGICKTFDYGGCGGNTNNYANLEACERHCKPERICALPAEVGPCNGYFPRYYHNKHTGTCETFIYGGCRGNQNNFETWEACQSRCKPGRVCDLPSVVGPCKAIEERYYYDRETGTCQKFLYGGCEGNGNNFLTQEACENKCKIGICEMSPETGDCRAYTQRYYYDQETGICKTFIYGGCNGNENNFLSEEDCENACKSANGHSPRGHSY
ncbi:papilin-like isoform X1 [Rana temporaria]|uniref:papilin-like isoform X1 n=1 Tax=Rana temporaria TaxID=8407 RepID=UPI001AAD7005|nr:papilin-like isoform X1 [Rana temporaria]